MEAQGLPAPCRPLLGLCHLAETVWEEAEPREVQPSRETGGTVASQKTETGNRKQVGKEGASSKLEWVGEGGRQARSHSLKGRTLEGGG